MPRRCGSPCWPVSDWLRRLQNRDGGWPTFCRGWGKLPFDRSSNDLTAHAIRALQVAEQLGTEDRASTKSSFDRARAFLLANQQADGSWLPLWFGNQDRADESNPVYGTSRVLVASAAFLGEESVRRGCDYLISVQNGDGGWGGGPSVTSWFSGWGWPTTNVGRASKKEKLRSSAAWRKPLWQSMHWSTVLLVRAEPNCRERCSIGLRRRDFCRRLRESVVEKWTAMASRTTLEGNRSHFPCHDWQLQRWEGGTRLWL